MDQINANGLIPLNITDKLDHSPEIQRWERWMTVFLLLGLAVRCVRYFVHYPLWEDECFTGVSIYKRGFLELLTPLEYHQVAPVLFLWLGKLCTLVFGFNELALRLPAFLCSLVSLWLVWHVSGRLLTGSARMLGLGFFAVAYPNIRYAAEFKPYGTDMFASLVLVAMLLEWLVNPQQRRWLVGLILWCPLAIGLSFPAIFTAGGVSLIVFLTLLLKVRDGKSWLIWLIYNGVVAASFVLVFKVVIAGQMKAEMGYLGSSWSDTFPSITQPVAFIKWLVLTHTGSMFAHPAGSDRGGSALTAILYVTGLIVLFRRGYWQAALLLLAPLGMNFAAAVLQKYPYGGHVKFSMYFSPMLNLVIGVGAAALLESHARRASALNLRVVMGVVLGLMTLAGVVCGSMDVVKPYKNAADMRLRGFSQWFWYNTALDGEAYCVKDDLGISFSPRTWSDLSWSAMYLCNKYIYQPKEMIREPRPKYYAKPAGRYLYYVIYKDWHFKDFDQAAYDRWLEEVCQQYRLVSRDAYPLVRNDKKERRLFQIDEIEILKFAADDESDRVITGQ